jgi:hypothetical protein
VPECPLCGATTPETAPNCPTCGLAASLFGPLREELSEEDPPSPSEGARVFPEVLALVRELGGSAASVPGPAAVARAARFPAARSPRAGARTVPPTVPSVERPAILAADRERSLLREVEELQQLARRLGADISPLELPLADALRDHDLPALEELRRGLFVRNAAVLAEGLDRAMARRHELAAFTAVPHVDAGIEEVQRAFGRGDLPGAFRRLQRAVAELELREEEWTQVKVLSVEADLLVETISDLGGDPTPALAPLAASRRWARDGDIARVERSLARTILALWRLASPLLVAELRSVRGALAAADPSDGDLTTARAALQEMADALARRNFSDAILAYRAALEAVDRLGASPLGRSVRGTGSTRTGSGR